MQFTDPIAFFFLLLIPLLLVVAIMAARKRTEGWKQLIGPRLRHSLVQEGAKARRWLSFSFGLAALTLLIVTLTTPHAGYEEEKEVIRGRNLLIAIDVSRSMLAKDESPDRLTAARAAALEILELFPSDRIGIIAFSGGPWLHAPLTIDHSALAETLLQLDAETLPRGGSDLSRAVKLAIETFKESGQPNNTLIILSDGEAHDGDAQRAAEQAAEANLTIFTIGFGSEEGGFIPDPDREGERLRDSRGNLIFTQLKSEDLRLLADKTGGFYTQGSGKQLSRSLQTAVERMEATESEGGQKRILIHRFQWFLLPAMIFLILSLLTNIAWPLLFRRSAAALMLSCFLSPGLDARVLPPTAAEKALAAEDYESALKLFDAAMKNAQGERLARLNLGKGAAAYHTGDFESALKAYSGALLSNDSGVQKAAHFSLANALYQQGVSRIGNEQSPDPEGAIKHLTDALGHYDDTLAIQEDYVEAQKNREHVEKILEMLKQQQEQSQESEDQKNEEKQDNENQDNQQDQEGNNSEDSSQNNQEQKDQNQDSSSEEDPQNDQNNEEQGEQNQESSSEGQDQEQQPPQPDPDSSQSEADQQQANQPQSDQNQSQSLAQNQPVPNERDPRESPEEFARRILEQNADFQTTPLLNRHLKQPRTDKEW